MIALVLSFNLHFLILIASYYYFVKCNVLIIDLNESIHTLFTKLQNINIESLISNVFH